MAMVAVVALLRGTGRHIGWAYGLKSAWFKGRQPPGALLHSLHEPGELLQ